MNLPANLPPNFALELQKQMMMENAKKSAYMKEYKRLKQQALQTSLSGMQNNGWVTVYTNQVPYELDVLRSNLYQKSDLGWFIRTVLGVGVGNALFAVGFHCQPISPPGMSVTVGPGVIYYFDFLLPTAYSVIPQDITADHQVYKSYISFDTQTFSTPAPSTPGDSIIYLIQGAHTTADVNVVSRPYYNDANPQTPIFTSQSDTMIDYTNLAIKPGVAAASPTPPTPDSGYTALYYVTVAQGQTSIISGNITVVPGAPFITESLTQKLGSLSGVSSSEFQNATQIFALDIGTTNALVANATPAYGTLTQGQRIFVKAANTITGSSTLNVNSNGNVSIRSDNLNLTLAGEIKANNIYEFIYNSSVPCWQLVNPTKIAIVCQVSASTATITGSVPISWDTIDFDNFSLFNGTTRITPKRAGNYNFYAIIQGTATNVELRLYINGVVYKHGSIDGSTSSILQCGIYMNGTTDYAECHLNVSSTLSSILDNYFGCIYQGD